jgi:hypothetical protein
MLKIRLWGKPAEVEAGSVPIRAAFEVLSEQGDVPDRSGGPFVRRFFEVELAAKEWTDWTCPLCGEVIPHIDSAAHLELGHDARREYRERKFPVGEERS